MSRKGILKIVIGFFSSWAKGIGVTVVIISIFEMILPNNNSKKYIRMVLGIYLIFNIVSPLIKNKELLNINNIEMNEISVSTSIEEVDQTSMNKRIKKLYEQEIEKDVIKKLKEKGYELITCKVSSQISSNKDEETKINKIKIDINKKSELNNENEKLNEESTEYKIVTEIQKIKKVETKINTNQEKEKNSNPKEDNKNITKTDIQNIKKFLIDEYGVNEQCLEIN